MDTIIYLTLTIAYLVLFIWGIQLANRHGWIRMENVLLLVILALLYDNAILGLGKYIGEGEVLQSLSVVRYWLHALITPLLVLFAWRTLVNADVEWAKSNVVRWIAILLTLSLIIYDLAFEVWNIGLEPAWKNGVLSYQVVNNEGNLPIMIIGVSVVLFITSLFIWIKQRWPWCFIGILFMSITPLLGTWLGSDAFHNIGEFVLLQSLLATRSFQQQRDCRMNEQQ